MTTSYETQRDELLHRLYEVAYLDGARSLLNWDQTTYMPSAGAAARGRQLALLSKLSHERFTDPAVGHLLDALQPWADGLPYDSDDASLVRVTRRQYERATRVPASFMEEFVNHSSTTYAAWERARPANDFASVQPLLEKTLELSRRYSDFFPGYAHIADPLIDRADFGMTVAQIRPLFTELGERLTELIQKIGARPQVDVSCLHGHFPEQKQWDFGIEIIKAYGYDFSRGRQDKTAHPFTTKFDRDDVRITTRIREDELDDALFSTLHECGHALYELGIDPALRDTPLDTGTSAGVHESQSRLWENLVGRSRGFWEHYYPRLQETFPHFSQVPMEQFYRAVNRVTPSLIRTDADEVTYNLHVIIRFGLEVDLLEGKVEVKDLPEVWRTRYMERLGVASPDDRDGCLQDVHWYADFIGGVFQGYTLGNILTAQFYNTAVQAHPDIPGEIRQGKFDTLHTWLRENIYRHGSKFTTDELVQRVTGRPLELDPYLGYLTKKYQDIYGF